MKRTASLFAFIIAFSSFTFAQDKINFMNGSSIPARVLGASSFEVRFQIITRNGKAKLDTYPTERVFSIVDSTGKETVWYFQDPMMGNEMGVDEMRWHINGQRDARSGYRSPWATWGGFVLGAGSVIGFDLEVNSLLIPPVWAGLTALPRVSVTRGSISDQAMTGNEHYALGYAQVGKTKRVLRGLAGCFAGVAVGLLTRRVINNNQ